MFNSCFKFHSIKCFHQNLLRHLRAYQTVLNRKTLSTDSDSDDIPALRSQKLTYFHKNKRVLKEIQLIEYENQFQDQRCDDLKPIEAKDYKNWLTTVCFEAEESPDVFKEKYRKIDYICHIYNDILRETFRVPQTLKTDKMLDLMEIYSESEITKQIQFLYEIEMKKWVQRVLQKEENLKNQLRLEQKHLGRTSRIGLFDNQNELVYGLWHNTLFNRIRPKAYRNYISKTRLKTSSLFGQKVVIDFGFEEYLNNISAKQLMSYLIKTISFNKYKLLEPFDISFHNFNSSGYLWPLMERYFEGHHPLEYYIDLESDSYLKRFDVNKLCYICPQADEPLREYDHNAVYILPGVINHLMRPQLSMMRIRTEGIKMKRIPFEEFASFKDGFHLELNNTLQILSYFRDYNDWEKAFEKYIPKTFFKPPERFIEEDKEIVKKMFYKQKIDFHYKTKIYRKIE